MTLEEQPSVVVKSTTTTRHLWRCRKWQRAGENYPDFPVSNMSGSFSAFLCPANCKPVRQRILIFLTDFCSWTKCHQFIGQSFEKARSFYKYDELFFISKTIQIFATVCINWLSPCLFLPFFLFLVFDSDRRKTKSDAEQHGLNVFLR